MEFQLLLDTASRFLHVATAVAVVGGTIFMRCVLHPAARDLPTEAHDQLRAGVLARWKRFVHGGIGLFLLTGFYNFFRLMGSHKGDTTWRHLIEVKVVLALVIFFLASALVGRSKTFEGMRAQRPKWLGIIAVLALVIIGISSFAKVRGIPAPTTAPASVETP